ncbi:hypothetical protein PIJPGVCJ_CDS0211 [Escherichia phage MIZ5]|nr:hypothetical protein XCVQDTFY_CDS0211 [Krischvirus RB49]WNA15275.1 hypothetical protein PIJPGVCJ_CDS0211 [Krischvirus RB49]
MQVYTNSNKGQDITPGKMYDFTPARDDEHPPTIGYIKDDIGYRITILLDGVCSHLRGDKWELVP